MLAPIEIIFIFFVVVWQGWRVEVGCTFDSTRIPSPCYCYMFNEILCLNVCIPCYYWGLDFVSPLWSWDYDLEPWGALYGLIS